MSGETQDAWLNHHYHKPIEVVLANAKTIEGTLEGFDGETLVLKRSTGEHDTMLVFKNAIQYVEEAMPDPGLLA